MGFSCGRKSSPVNTYGHDRETALNSGHQRKRALHKPSDDLRTSDVSIAGERCAYSGPTLACEYLGIHHRIRVSHEVNPLCNIRCIMLCKGEVKFGTYDALPVNDIEHQLVALAALETQAPRNAEGRTTRPFS